MRYVAADQGHKEWFCHLISYHPTSQFGGIVAEDEDGEVMGMIGMDFWTPKSVQLHVVIINPKCTLSIWGQVVQYLRSQGRRLAIGVTPSDKPKALALIWRLGFKETHRFKDAWDDGVDMVISEYDLNEQQHDESSDTRPDAGQAEFKWREAV